MKCVLLIVLLFCASVANAVEVQFSWIPNSEPVEGYKIHYGKESRNYSEFVDVGKPVVEGGRVIGTVSDIPRGETYYYAATAYNTDEESDYSNEVMYRAPLAKPGEPQDMKFNIMIDLSISVTQ